MKKLAVGLFFAAPLAMASSLEVQPGQWSVTVDNTDGYVRFDRDVNTYPGVNETYKYNDFDLGLWGNVKYGLSETLNVGLGFNVSLDTTDNFTTISGVTTSTDFVDYDIRLDPYLEWAFNQSLSLYANLGLRVSPAGKTVDQDGVESLSGEKERDTWAYVGLIHRQDLSDKLLWENNGMIGMEHYYNESPTDSSVTTDFYYRNLNLSSGVRYFIYDVFSVNATATYHRDALTKRINSGVTADLNGATFIDNYLVTRLGFTLYLR